jgi:hypothetical protein
LFRSQVCLIGHRFTLALISAAWCRLIVDAMGAGVLSVTRAKSDRMHPH